MGKIAARIMRLRCKVSTTKTVINRHPTPHHKRQIIITVTGLILLGGKTLLHHNVGLIFVVLTMMFKDIDEISLTGESWKHRNMWQRNVFSLWATAQHTDMYTIIKTQRMND